MELRVVFIAKPGVDEHRTNAAHDERTHRQENAIAVVRLRLLLPHHLGNHTEHRAAVEAEETVEEADEFEVADAVSLYFGSVRLQADVFGLLEFHQNAVRG